MEQNLPGRSSAQPLMYGVSPGRGRRRRIVIAFLLICGIGILLPWVRPSWNNARILYAQWRCLSYSAPPDRVIFEEDPTEAAKLLALSGYHTAESFYMDPGGGVMTKSGTIGRIIQTPQNAVYRPPALDDLLLIGRVNLYGTGRLSGLGYPGHPQRSAVAFVGELRTPPRERWLVVVECDIHQGRFDTLQFHVAVLRPATTFAGLAMTTPVAVGIVPNGFGATATGPVRNPGTARVFAGQIDANDPSHFTIAYEASGISGSIDGKINSSGSVTLNSNWPINASAAGASDRPSAP